jgi:hypothetical protein
MEKAKERDGFRIAAVVLAAAIVLVCAGGVFLLVRSQETKGASAQTEGKTETLKAIEPGEGETKLVKSISVSASGSSKEADSKKPKEDADKEDKNKEDKNKDYILPASNTKLLTSSDIAGLSLKELNYAKNEIYARHGRKFDSNELRTYFESKSWYEGKYSAADFDANYSARLLSDTERKNAEFLKNAEYAMSGGGYQLDQ